MYKEANAGHVGCSLSCLEIITFIKFQLMKEHDDLILSKGHAAALLYSVLAEEGIITEKDIETFYKNGTYLSAHPPVNKIRKIPFATGSLGHGLSLAAGLGLASKLKNQDKNVFCITSDGELNEGSTWEAALFISHHNLKNIFWFIDRNYIQGFGRTEDTLRLDPLDRKLESFGFEVITAADGTQAVALAQAQLPDLILMDMGLPILSGWQATAQLKAAPDTHAIPIVALTAYAMAEDRDRAYTVGCDEFETKPVNFLKLKAKIDTLLARKEHN